MNRRNRTSKRTGESVDTLPTKKATPEKSAVKAKTASKKKDTGKENVSRKLVVSEEPAELLNFVDETETITGSAIDNYFMQGKSAAERMNTKPRRGKTAQQVVDKENKPKSSLCASFTKCDLNDLKSYIDQYNSSTKKSKLLEELDETDFSKWTLYLASGFNILLHGVGSKRDLLTAFAERELSSFTRMRIDARNEETSPKILLAAINSHMKLKCNGKGIGIVDWARSISESLKKAHKQVVLLIDNIEAQDWRHDQEAICALLENRESVKLVATVDHVYSTFIWNSRQLSSLNFIHITVNTFAIPLQELITGESRLLGLDASSNQSSHTEVSLDIFWKSLASNWQKLFRLFFKMYFETKKPVNFFELFGAAKDDFIVSSDTALRTQLVEFKDHRILKWARSDDGNDQLVGIVDQALVSGFLASKGMSLDDENE